MSDLLRGFEQEQREMEEKEKEIWKKMEEETLDESEDDNDDHDDEEDEEVDASLRAAFSSRSVPPSTRQSSSSTRRSTSSASASILDSQRPVTPTHRHSSDPFEFRGLVWHQIASSTPLPAHAELRRLIGAELIDMNQQLDDEVTAMASIVSTAQIEKQKRKRQLMDKEAEQGMSKQYASSAVSASAGICSIAATSTSATVRPLSRAPLLDSAARSLLIADTHALILALHHHATKRSSPAIHHSQSSRNSQPNTTINNSVEALQRILPRPDSARQGKVMREMTDEVLRIRSASSRSQSQHSHPQSNADTAQSQPSSSSIVSSSAPASRPSSSMSSGRLTARHRPSTARMRSLSSSSSSASLNPTTSSSSASLAAAAESLTSALLTVPASLTTQRSGSSSERSDGGDGSNRSSTRSNNNDGGTADSITALLASIRQALRDERAALESDIAYLQQCAEIEVDERIEAEKQEKAKEKTKAKEEHPTSSSSSSSSLSSSDSTMDVITVSELRALNARLQETLTLEEQRAHTIDIMNKVAVSSPSSIHLPSPIHAPPIVMDRSASSSTASPFPKSPGPLKAIRIPSAARMRPASGSNAAAASASSSASSLHASPAAPPSSTRSRPSSGPPAPTASPPAPNDMDVHDLIAANADLFSEDAPTAISSSNTKLQPSPAEPVHIPTLPLNGLTQSTAQLSDTDNKPLQNRHDDEWKESATTAPSSFMSHPASVSHSTQSTLASASVRPVSVSVSATPRTTSKARSRIQAAQMFTAAEMVQEQQASAEQRHR